MAARKNISATRNTKKPELDFTGPAANEDNFARIKPGFQLDTTGDRIRGTFNFSRKKMAKWSAAVAAAAGLVFSGAPRISNAVNAYRNSGAAHGAAATEQRTQPVQKRQGGRLEYTDANGDKLVFTLPDQPDRPKEIRSASATQAQLPAPALPK
jgi:hypothetical protein